MKTFVAGIILLFSLSVQAQTMDGYLESIRDNEAGLIAFFSQMPKGGDLHHHFTGSVYAETYLERAVTDDYYVNTASLEIAAAAGTKGQWMKFSQLKDSGMLDSYKQKLMQKWSVKDYNGVSYPSDKQFFETFGAFGPAAKLSSDAGLLELKKRAKLENVSYIETMFTSIPCSINMSGVQSYNAQLRKAQESRDEALTLQLLTKLDALLSADQRSACVDIFNRDSIAGRHKRLQIDDAQFTLRYQTYVNRTSNPIDLFRTLLLAFESANKSPLVVGVNIVSPEDNETSMRDYWLHMMMFRYCHTKYESVKYAMHAGELTLGLVKPEELTWHINAAVRVAGANRIGHGVDMAYEQDSYDLLRLMSRKKTVIEINLFSNEFILKVKDDAHPISLYREYDVPMVICTDDAGVLRSNLTHQYVLLAMRYKDVRYEEIKKFVYNSIRYSFIEDSETRERLKKDLDTRFSAFEAKVLNRKASK